MIDPKEYTLEQLIGLIPKVFIKAGLQQLEYKSTDGSETVNKDALSELNQETVSIQVVYPPKEKLNNPKLVFSFDAYGQTWHTVSELTAEGLNEIIIATCNRLILGPQKELFKERIEGFIKERKEGNVHDIKTAKKK